MENMQGIINNLRHSYSVHSQSKSEFNGNHRMGRSLSKKSQTSFEGEVRKMPRTQNSITKKKTPENFSTSVGFTDPKPVRHYKGTSALWLSNDLKKQMASTQQSRIMARTAVTNKYMQPCIVRRQELVLKPKQNNTNQLWNLRLNDIFFCVQCFRYVFRIEFDYHYPKCKEQISTESLSKKGKKEMGVCKFRLLKELVSMLKKTEQTRLLQRVEQIKLGTVERKQPIPPRKGSFYLVEDIQSVIELIGIHFFN